MTERPGGGERYADDGRRYRLDSRIATGGMGEVWRGTDTVLNRAVAIKLLKPEYADDPSFRSRFETEARHAGSLHHPGIASVFDFGEGTAPDGAEAKRPFLVMELVDGEPLSALLRPGQPMDPDVTRHLLSQAAAAIGAAHAAGIVHRDVKPANLLVTPGREVKITDFGIARAADAVALTQTGQVMGTPQYLSPEQARGNPATPASDVYSLGVVAFECLAGRRPYVADSPVATALAHLREPVPALPPEVPADLAAVVRKAMAKEAHDRFADGAELAAALRDPATAATALVPPPEEHHADTGTHTEVLAAAGAAGAAGLAGAAAADEASPTGAAPGPGPTGPTGPTEPGGRRRRGALWLLLGGLAVLVLLAIGFVVFANTGDDTTPTQNPTRTPARQHTPSAQPTETVTSSAPAPTQSPSASPSATAPTPSPSSSPSQSPSTSTSPSGSATSTPTTASSAPSSSQPSSPVSQESQSQTEPQPSATATSSTAGTTGSRTPTSIDDGKAAR